MTPRRDERGTVTAELAVVMPLLVALAFLMLWIVSLGLTQVRLADASREAARMVARGDTAADARAVARAHAPDGAIVDVERADGLVEVTVRSRSSMPIPFFSGIGARTLTSTSVAADEGP